MRTDGFLYIEQAAKQIGIHRNTLRRWIKEGKLEPVIGRAKRDIRNWLVFPPEDIQKIKTYAQTITSP